ncbi:MAG TPA: hypothetical protein VNO22_02835 [Planctomycetota bacterium]|nr:hypothetical protein [Planctomycetota bacterium]
MLDRAVNATESAIGIRLSDPLRDKLRRRLRRLKFFNLETVQDIARRAVDFAWGDPEQILRPQFPPRGLIVPESPPWADPRRPGWGHWTAWDRAVVDWFSEALAALWSREPAFLEILDWVRENVLRTAQCAVRGTR